jgi:hypothetical protein
MCGHLSFTPTIDRRQVSQSNLVPAAYPRAAYMFDLVAGRTKRDRPDKDWHAGRLVVPPQFMALQPVSEPRASETLQRYPASRD